MSHPYVYPSRVLVYTLINQKNGTRWNPTDATLENFRVDEHSTDFRNTLVDLVGVASEGITGSVTVRYRRVDLGEIFSQCTLEVPWEGQSSTLELMASINTQYGTRFNAEDIVLTYFNPNTLPLDITVTASPTSPAYVGSVSIRVIPMAVSLQTEITQQVVQPFDYPSGQSTKGQGLLYLRPYSFDYYWTYLKGLSVGQLSAEDSDSVLSLINGVLGLDQQWVNDAVPTLRNLNNGNGVLEVSYVGVPILQYTHRLTVDRILVLQLSDQYCTGFAGVLVMHYNNPSQDLDETLVNKDIGRVSL